MTAQLEGKHAAEFLLVEGPGTLSREVGTLAGDSEEVFEPGQVLAWDGTFLVKLSDLTGVADDTETTEDETVDPESVAGILLHPANGGDQVVYIARLAEVKESALVFEGTGLTAEDVAAALAAKDIIVR